MKRLFALASILMLLACPGCGGDSHDSLAADGVSTMKKLVSVLEGVTDEASAQSAKPELQSLMDKLNAINAKQAKLPAPTDAEMKDMDAKYSKEMEEVSTKLQGQMFRIMADPKIGPVLQDIKMNPK